MSARYFSTIHRKYSVYQFFANHFMVSDDAFEGLVNDYDYIGGWFTVRKIKGRHKSGIKSVKSNLTEESPNTSMQSIGNLS